MQELRQHLPEGTQHVIFDWNGTLLNDIDLAVDCISELLQENALAPISRDHYRKHFRFPVREYYESLGFDFEATPFEQIAHLFIERYNQRVRNCALFEGARELLGELQESGFGLSILSAAQQNDLEWVLEHHAIRPYFEHVYGIQDRFAVSKVERGKQLLKTLGVPREQVVMIGDTDHDAEVAEAIGISSLILGDGHQCADRLHARFPGVIRSRYFS